MVRSIEGCCNSHRQEVTVADDLDRTFGSAPQRGLVDGGDRCIAAGLAHDPGMHHAVESHVMGKDGFAEHLRGEVEARRVLPDDAIVSNALGCRQAGRMPPEIDGAGERPIIMAGRLPAMNYGPVAHRQIRTRVAEISRGMVEKRRAHFSTCPPQCDAAELDRLAAGSVAFIGCQVGVAGLQQNAIGGDVELLGGDLQHCGQHALADFDPAGRNRDMAGGGKPDPLIEARIGRQQRRQGR
jgi:hypothetical protein